jgi:hypothetical protein
MEFHRRTGVFEEGLLLIKTPAGMLAEFCNPSNENEGQHQQNER